MSKVASQADYEHLLELASQDAESAKENALRQLEHLRREIDYGYPPEAMEAESRRFRDLVRRYPNAGKRGASS